MKTVVCVFGVLLFLSVIMCLPRILHVQDCACVFEPPNQMKQVSLQRVSDTLKVLSYNLNNLPLFTSVEPRATHLLRFLSSRLEDTDVFFFQEVFTEQYIKILSDFFKQKNFHVVYGNPKTRYYTLVNGGLFIATKYTPRQVKGINFSDCVLFDCFSKKGAIKIQVTKGRKEYTVVNTHLQDSSVDVGGSVRVGQIEEIRKEFSGENVVVIGDLNTPRRQHEIQNYAHALFDKYTQPEKATFPAKNLVLDAAMGKRVDNVVTIDPNYETFVSDHLPILVTVV
jgi:endonuclease/exonuclease/phosphatase family metal-dependent hydrolase